MLDVQAFSSSMIVVYDTWKLFACDTSSLVPFKLLPKRAPLHHAQHCWLGSRTWRSCRVAHSPKQAPVRHGHVYTMPCLGHLMLASQAMPSRTVHKQNDSNHQTPANKQSKAS